MSRLGPPRYCAECGQDHVSKQAGQPCMGHISSAGRRGEPCAKNAMEGQDKCGHHGGSSPQAKAAAERRLVEEQAEKALRRFGLPIDTTPTEALLDSVKWTAGHVAWLRTKVAEALDDDELTQYSKVTGKSEPSVWEDMLERWTDRSVRVYKAAIDAGIEERRVRIAEQQGALVADVIRKILGDLELTPEQAAKAGEVVPFRLRAIAGGAA